MNSRQPKPLEFFLKFFVTCLTLFFIILAISSKELSTNQSTDSSQQYNKNLRNKRAVTKSVMSAPAPYIAALTKINIHSAPIPPFLYGTAWKKDRTEELVILAVKSGFRGIDTACQPKHYYEPGVGDALEKLYSAGVVERSDIFLQTKYTPYDGQDPNNVPYDKNAEFADQVMQSYRKSLSNLKTNYLDSLVLHSPLNKIENTIEVHLGFMACRYIESPFAILSVDSISYF